MSSPPFFMISGIRSDRGNISMYDGHSKALPFSRGATLNSLKEELYSLNMRLLLAIQYHKVEAQEVIQAQMAAVQAEIEHMSSGGGIKIRGKIHQEFSEGVSCKA